MSEIRVLSKEVAELIAAGEVIERPASVIKELLENAVDAGSTAITVEIKNGGRTYMRVTDNGCGISYEDVPTAFLRHATSKVSEKADLDSISTLGFRGEALASICAVAKVEILTKTNTSEFGTRYQISGGEETAYEPAGCPEGTNIIIRDLFYNVPARLKFLKKDATEANKIQELMGRLAVSHPEISIKLIRDNKPVIVTAGDGKLYSSVYSVFGRDFANSLLPVNYISDGIKVEGFISKPLQSKSNRKFQIFYVNDRYVRSEVCSQALEEAYRNNIMVGKFPACVIKVKIPPEMIDVNVHPAKTEIRFSDNRFIYNSVYFAIRDALLQKDKPTQMKLDNSKYYDKSELYVQPQQPKAEQMVFAPSNESSSVSESVINVELPKTSAPKSGDNLFLKSLDGNEQTKPWEGFLQPAAANENTASDNDAYDDEAFLKLCDEYDSHQAEKSYRTEPAKIEDDSIKEIADSNVLGIDGQEFQYIKADDFVRKQPEIIPEPQENMPEKPVVVGELFKTYIVAQCGNDMLLIDKHAAHERFIFENIKNDSRNLSSQLLLEPIMVMLSFDEYDALSVNIDKAAKLGFTIEPDVAPTIAVTGLPMILRDENPTDIITEIAQKLASSERDPAPDFYDDLYHTMACKAAIKAHDDSKPEELQKLLDSIYGREDIRYCPHGRPVMITMPKKEIEKQFKRIV